MDLCFTINVLETFSSDSGIIHFEGFAHLLRYIRDNNNLELKYYAKIDYTFISDLLRQASINTENQLMVFSDSLW